ncbi:RluA family pseudouridine synthase [Kordiimonas marina]|uniref:RluA family pseudouridine synthase n=1 Tax=Kordiimonas marina TaxID=2872312 RepID=UPI001FF686EA|nr:RluA family pseudouridine synthase [Kordiimonas marina]MCJ9427592.1 RluA family pseudouridine synthase [Kordiimonas marina]
MTDKFDIHITDEMAGARLDKILADALPDLSRSRLKALIKEGEVTRTGDAAATIKSPSQAVKPGECYRVNIPAPEEAEPQAEDIPLDVVYEDDDLIVVNKPAGMVVHPAPGSPSGTLVNALLHHCGASLSGIGGVRRPGIVHRIDKDTSGLLIMAKNDKAHHGLAEQFAAHTIERVYAAVCKGHPVPPKGRIEGDIARHPVDRKRMAVTDRGGKWAATHYETLAHYQVNGTPLASLIECRLETGRTHQVRVHMAHIGHPLIGDPVYARGIKLSNSVKGDARAALQSFKRQALHARVLGFIHPISGKTFKFESELPHDMADLLAALDPYKV